MANDGVVKFFNIEKGYGFIQPAIGDAPDVFVHIRELRQSGLEKLNEGQKVKFDTEPGKNGKGPKAVRIVAA